jgi:squalene cyclase
MTRVPLLLADPSPCLRLLVLRNLLKQEHNEEIKELEKIREKDQLVSELLQLQAADGSWGKEAVTGNVPGANILGTARSLTRLGYLGFGPEHPAVQRGARYLFRFQREDGSWPLAHYSPDGEGSGNYQVISLQTSLPLRGLAACGYAAGPRVEKAYEWLLEQRLEDGAWPTGIAHGNYGNVAGYRRLAHSRWVTYDILNSLTRIAGASDWISLEPRTPFRTYPEKKKRY